MADVIIIQHHNSETPGIILNWLHEKGLTFKILTPYKNPINWEEI